MSFAVGDKVVANGLPGVVTQVQTVGGTTTYEVAMQQCMARWLNSTQFTGGGPATVGAQVLVGNTPGQIVGLWSGGPYPLYQVIVCQTMSAWLLPAQINPPLPAAPAQPASVARVSR